MSKGVFSKNADLKTVKFSAPVTARFVKLTALSGYSKIAFASLAEFNAIPAP